MSLTISVISGFRRYVDDICALLGYYTASNGNPLLTLRNSPEERISLKMFCPDAVDPVTYDYLCIMCFILNTYSVNTILFLLMHCF
jgi:hypothetical protein